MPHVFHPWQSAEEKSWALSLRAYNWILAQLLTRLQSWNWKEKSIGQTSDLRDFIRLCYYHLLWPGIHFSSPLYPMHTNSHLTSNSSHLISLWPPSAATGSYWLWHCETLSREPSQAYLDFWPTQLWDNEWMLSFGNVLTQKQETNTGQKERNHSLCSTAPQHENGSFWLYNPLFAKAKTYVRWVLGLKIVIPQSWGLHSSDLG